ncbi:hypothetical protein B0J17DRAFT_669998 [Rhizoctonia solani]|nr:hypothetical protein B0J17DRAFT_669998 [Rhizoctonia solani]
MNMVSIAAHNQRVVRIDLGIVSVSVVVMSVTMPMAMVAVSMTTVGVRMNMVVVPRNDDWIVCIYLGSVAMFSFFPTKGMSTMVTMALLWGMRSRGVFVV